MSGSGSSGNSSGSGTMNDSVDPADSVDGGRACDPCSPSLSVTGWPCSGECSAWASWASAEFDGEGSGSGAVSASVGAGSGAPPEIGGSDSSPIVPACSDSWRGCEFPVAFDSNLLPGR